MDDLREVVKNDIKNDVQALLDLGIVVIGNLWLEYSLRFWYDKSK